MSVKRQQRDNSEPSELLETLNRLRTLETRQVLEVLPAQFNCITGNRRENLLKEWKRQISIHEYNISHTEEYSNRIILNRTEEKFIHEQKLSKSEKPIKTFARIHEVHAEEKDFYFPIDKEEAYFAFITDTESKYIHAITTAQSNNETYLLAKHSLPDSISFVPGAADLILKRNNPIKRERQEFEPLTIDPVVTVKSSNQLEDLEQIFRPKRQLKRENSPQAPPNPTEAEQITPNIKLETTRAEEPNTFKVPLPVKPLPNKKIFDNTTVLESLQLESEKDDSEHLHSPTSTLLSDNHSGKTYSITSNPSSSEKSDKSTLLNKFLDKLYQFSPRKFKKFLSARKLKMATRKDGDDSENELTEPTDKEIEKIFTIPAIQARIDAIVTDLMSKKSSGMILRSGKYIKPQDPKKEKGAGIETDDEDEIVDVKKLKQQKSDLLFELGKLKEEQQPVRPFALSEQQEIGNLRNQIAEMAKIMQSMQLEVKQKTSLTEQEKQRLRLLSEPIATPATPLIYKLNYPSNILGNNEFREALYILKAPAIVATIGIFDPDSNDKHNFRETWERIQNYTRNYWLYEHEYVDILMTVMKGSAGTCLTDMIREFGGQLRGILEAIQDIYVPQHTIFDDVDELNKFIRPKNENIRTTMRRASLIVYKLRNQCAAAAWPERKYHMLLALIKQVIDKKTVRHLHTKELECAQAGMQLDFNTVVNIVALHEQTHNLTPITDVRLKYNINSMQIIEHTDTDHLHTHQIKSLTMDDKRKQHDRRDSRSSSREILTTPRKPDRERHESSLSRSSTPERSPTPTSPYNLRERKPRYDTTNYSQRKADGTRDYRSTSPYPSKTASKPSYQTYQQKQKSSPYQQNYKQSNNQNRSYTSNKTSNNYNSDRKPTYTKTFNPGKNKVTLNFYKCDTCPSLHPEGDECKETLNK